MKKISTISAVSISIFVSVFVIVLSPSPTAAEDLIGRFGLSYFSPIDEAFRDIYGGGLRLSGEISMPVWANFEAWLGMSILGRTGEMTYTKDEIRLKIIPIMAGVRYVYPLNQKLNIYTGLGAAYFFYHEEIPPLGNINKSSLGVVIKAGGSLYLTDRMFVDLFVDYSTSKVEPFDYEVEIGGIAFGFGLGYVI